MMVFSKKQGRGTSDEGRGMDRGRVGVIDPRYDHPAVEIREAHHFFLKW